MSVQSLPLCLMVAQSRHMWVGEKWGLTETQDCKQQLFPMKICHCA